MLFQVQFQVLSQITRPALAIVTGMVEYIAMLDTIHIRIYTLKDILYYAIRQKEDKIMNTQRNVTKKDQKEIDNFAEIMSGFDDGEHVCCAYHGKQKAIGNYAECEQCLIDDKNEQMARLEVEAEKIGYYPGNQEE